MTRKAVIRFACISLLTLSSTGNATDYVRKDLRCPGEVYASVDFVKHIGSDPTFQEGGGGGAMTRMYQPRISRSGQKLTCTYQCSGLLTGFATYEYTVKRKIIECKQLGMNHLQCLLDP